MKWTFKYASCISEYIEVGATIIVTLSNGINTSDNSKKETPILQANYANIKPHKIKSSLKIPIPFENARKNSNPLQEKY